jgi:type IV pilus assembly protein PilA
MEEIMKVNKLRMLASQKGFTLIELMIVIAIIGILAAVAIPNFIAYRDKSYCSAAESDANGIAGSLADYFAIPTHTTITGSAITIAAAGGLTNGITFPKLSGTNTATVGGGVSAISITVKDGTGRCPTTYQAANKEWSGSGTFNKKMK